MPQDYYTITMAGVVCDVQVRRAADQRASVLPLIFRLFWFVRVVQVLMTMVNAYLPEVGALLSSLEVSRRRETVL
jgi:hypothetical protein